MPTTPPKSLFQSLTIRSALALAVAFVASRAGVHLPDGLADKVIGAVIDLVGALGLVGVAVGRARASGPLS